MAFLLKMPFGALGIAAQLLRKKPAAAPQVSAIEPATQEAGGPDSPDALAAFRKRGTAADMLNGNAATPASVGRLVVGN